MSNIEIVCFSEGKYYKNNAYHWVSNNINRAGNIITFKDQRFSWNITGFTIINGRVVIIFPKNYLVPEEKELVKEHGMILLKALMRYRYEHTIEMEEAELLFGNKINDSSRISTAVFIIRDYLDYGLINRKRIIKSMIRDGKIDWALTIKKTDPIPSNGSMAYVSFVSKARIADKYNILRKIHEYVVHKSISLWGWLLDIDERGVERSELPCQIENAISFLSEELEEAFVQREINLIKALIEFLKAESGVQNYAKLEILATPYFYWVWEAVCGYIYGNQYMKLRDLVPEPKWHIKEIKAKVSQRPDILFIDEDVLYILDAKYYNYHRNVPGWHDVVKQLYYRQTIKSALNSRNKKIYNNIKHIENVFILPDTDNINTEYIGYVEVQDVEEMDIVLAYSINTKAAMKAYAFREESHFKENLILKLKEFRTERNNKQY